MFADHVALLRLLIDRRVEVAGRIEGSLLNVRGKDTSRRRDRPHFERLLAACVFGLPGLPPGAAALNAQLATRRVLDGFEPVASGPFVNQFDPLELIPRAYHYWEHHRWPGRSGREAYARAIVAAVLLRQLELLSMRVWDDGAAEAEARLGSIQDLVDALNGGSQPHVFVRDARWLILTAQGPLTRDLAPYFVVSDHVAGSFADATRLGLHTAAARLAGGHLRSQLRYRSWETRQPAGDPQNLVITRNSNALDGALLLRSLVPLLDAYEIACRQDQAEDRQDLADAILQGVSADPELFLTRLDLLAPYTMIEHLFVRDDGAGGVGYTAWGERHLETLARYRVLIGQLAPRLLEDAMTDNVVPLAYSPHGIAYGFSADMLSNIAWDFLVANPSLGLCLEDMFVSAGRAEDKLARARAWEALPTRAGERAHFEYASEVAADARARVRDALQGRAEAGARPNATDGHQARIVVSAEPGVSGTDDVRPDSRASASEHCLTSDTDRVSAGIASFCPAAQILEDRNEGRFLASGTVNGEWVAISKVILTLFTSQGKDAWVPEVPAGLIDILRLTCLDLVVLSEESATGPSSPPRPAAGPRA